MLGSIAYPVIDPVLISIGPFAVRWYGLAYVAGFVAAVLVFRALGRRWDVGLTDDDVATALLYCIIGVMVGGRLGYVLFYGFRGFLDEPLSVFRVWEGGMSFHGGLAGIVVAGLIVARTTGVPFLRLADMAAVGTPFGLFFGRLANFINNELWGRVTDVPWGVVFPGAGPQPRHPSQIYEALLEGAVMFVVLWVLSRRRRADGLVFGVFIGLYGVFRFVIEFFREPDAQLGFIAGGLSMGQLLSVPLVALGVWLVWKAMSSSSDGAGVTSGFATASKSDQGPDSGSVSSEGEDERV